MEGLPCGFKRTYVPNIQMCQVCHGPDKFRYFEEGVVICKLKVMKDLNFLPAGISNFQLGELFEVCNKIGQPLKHVVPNVKVCEAGKVPDKIRDNRKPVIAQVKAP